MEFPPIGGEFISSFWHFLERRCSKKGFSKYMSCATSSQHWLYYLLLIQTSCSVFYRGSIRTSWKQNLARTGIDVFSKGFLNCKHPSLLPHILLLDCFPAMLACVPVCEFRCMPATCILTPDHCIILFVLATAPQPTILGS